MSHAQGSKIYDVTGREYIDYPPRGPMILGHAHPEGVPYVRRRKGTSFGAPTDAETNMARLICEAIPSIERVRMTSSGTEMP